LGVGCHVHIVPGHQAPEAAFMPCAGVTMIGEMAAIGSARSLNPGVPAHSFQRFVSAHGQRFVRAKAAPPSKRAVAAAAYLIYKGCCRHFERVTGFEPVTAVLRALA
jgi:hypothetical protein